MKVITLNIDVNIPKLKLSENTFIIYIVTIYEKAASEYTIPFKNSTLYICLNLLSLFVNSKYFFIFVLLLLGTLLSLYINDNIILTITIIKTTVKLFKKPVVDIKLPNISGNIIDKIDSIAVYVPANFALSSFVIPSDSSILYTEYKIPLLIHIISQLNIYN